MENIENRLRIGNRLKQEVQPTEIESSFQISNDSMINKSHICNLLRSFIESILFMKEFIPIPFNKIDLQLNNKLLFWKNEVDLIIESCQSIIMSLSQETFQLLNISLCLGTIISSPKEIYQLDLENIKYTSNNEVHESNTSDVANLIRRFSRHLMITCFNDDYLLKISNHSKLSIILTIRNFNSANLPNVLLENYSLRHDFIPKLKKNGLKLKINFQNGEIETTTKDESNQLDESNQEDESFIDMTWISNKVINHCK